ncbi:MAG: bifunctional 5,10-methylenetetrahydrofolate dehydrogenase/5,10-methenyltetrahydrofolate cyclohydrolase [Cyanobium sp. MAG06]|nr:bifunctional 5,10-methylenetetrahydrofolate dehydrogenase/5,10-methenyltetrahydrofolate cyclohydrolase [Cyanobium sp. MAG06]
MSSIIQSNEIVEEIKSNQRDFFIKIADKKPQLFIYQIGPNETGEKYINKKTNYGREIGVNVNLLQFGFDNDIANLNPEDKQSLLNIIAENIKNNNQSNVGIIIQLPIHKSFSNDDLSILLNSITDDNDVDLLKENNKNRDTGLYKEPVLASVLEIFTRYSVELNNQNIVLIGNGKMVGQPIHNYFNKNNIIHELIDFNTDENYKLELIKNADIVISGVGKEGLIDESMIKDGVILIDVGTSTSNGVLKGDINRNCENKAKIFASVPGGVGPITITKIFENLRNGIIKNSLL